MGLRAPRGRKRVGATALAVAAVTAALCLALVACGSSPAVGGELAGTWVGLYTWDTGDSYEVVLRVPPGDIDPTESGKSVTFTAAEATDGCEHVDVKGAYDPSSHKIQLDEVAAPDCPMFLLAGLYEGTVDVETRSMRLLWLLDEEESPFEMPGGTLELLRTSDDPDLSVPR